jgi:hypothetical protein
VETGSRGPFDSEGRPTILFERHLFHRLTTGRFDNQDDISNVIAGGYGNYSDQYPKLIRAYALDADSALKSCSWGAYQILGINWALCGGGFNSVEDMVTAMRTGVQAHLKAFVEFVRCDRRMLPAIQAKDWAAFAKAYNGPNYAASGYDVKLAAAYAEASQ